MSTASPATLRFLPFLAAAVAVVAAAANGGGVTHLHLYIHDTSSTAAASFAGNSSSSFGTVGAIDDELREGPDAASQYLGRAQGFLVQADLGTTAPCTVVSLVFEVGDYGGSTLVVYGRVVDLGAGDGDGEAVAAELAVVGGTGRFRGARGYSLMTKLGNPTTPATAFVFEMDLYVKIGG